MNNELKVNKMIKKSFYFLFSKPFKVFQSFQYLSYLGFLSPNKGAVKKYKRLGRGPASGKGRRCGRGQKGQKARGKVKWWFEGGQTPFFKRLPKVGFKRPHKRIYNWLQLRRIQDFWDSKRIPLKPGETLNINIMKKCGLLTGSVKFGVKILSNGSKFYNVPLNIEASRASQMSIEAIEKLNCTFTAMYFTRFCLDAHLNPDKYYLKNGYLPLPARPTHRRDIEFYSNEKNRGYLFKDRSILLDIIESQKKINVKAEKKNLLIEQLSNKKHDEFKESNSMSYEDFLSKTN